MCISNPIKFVRSNKIILIDILVIFRANKYIPYVANNYRNQTIVRDRYGQIKMLEIVRFSGIIEHF